jgi:transcriptional regulator with XRE-family HTH domain
MSLSRVEDNLEKTTSYAISKSVGVDASHVRHILRGTRVPSLEVAARIARKLNVSLDMFYRYYSRQSKQTPVN